MAKLLDIGKSILRACAQSGKPLAEGNKAHDALPWLKKAFQIIEPLDCLATPELLELKVRVPIRIDQGSFDTEAYLPSDPFSGAWVRRGYGRVRIPITT